MTEEHYPAPDLLAHQRVNNGPDSLDTCTGCGWESWDTLPAFEEHLTRVTSPEVQCPTCAHPEGYDRLSGPCPTCHGGGATPRSAQIALLPEAVAVAQAAVNRMFANLWRVRHVESGATVYCRNQSEAEAHIREAVTGPWVAERVMPPTNPQETP